MNALSPGRLEFTAEGVPFSADYNDVYHSAAGALAQAEYVFLQGNGLPQRWQQRRRFVILETGFGLGNNFLATWHAWRHDPQRCTRLWYLALEKHPLTCADMRRVHQHSPLRDAAEQLIAQWPLLVSGVHRLEFENGAVQLLLCWGDANDWLAHLPWQADAVYLDGFAPAKNPTLWQPALMAELARHTQPDATVATYSAARVVRDALSAQGFHVQRRPGFAGKRDMTQGQRLGPAGLATRAEPGTALVVGAGLAGCAVAYRLAARGMSVHVLDALPGIAQGTSGNRMGAVQPVLMQEDRVAARFTRAAYGDTLRTVQRLRAAGQTVNGHFSGVLHVAKDTADAEKMRALLATQDWPADYVRWVDAAEASALAGVSVNRGGYWFAHAGWLHPASYCAALLASYANRVSVHCNQPVTHLAQACAQWGASCVILANAQAVRTWLPTLPLHTVRGQVSHWPAGAWPAPRVPVAGDGYVMPEYDGILLSGATYEHDAMTLELRATAHEENQRRVTRLLPGTAPPLPLQGRAGVRAVMPDRLPVAGWTYMADGLRIGLLTGLASRGLTWASLCAEVVAAQYDDDPAPLPQPLLQAIAPRPEVMPIF